MTKEELEELRSIKTEIKQLDEELHNLPMTKDSVTGSMTEHPYIQRTIQVTGLDMIKGAKIQIRLEGKLADLQGKLTEMEDWLDGVEDSADRSILRLYFRNAMTMKEIGAALGYSESMISKRLKKIFEKE